MLTQREAKARILSHILDFWHRNKWQDLDDFSLRFVDNITPSIVTGYLPYSTIYKATKSRTSFFIINKISRKQFCSIFIKELMPFLNQIGASTTYGLLTFFKIFPETGRISLDEAKRNEYKLIQLDERIIQDKLRDILREKGATNMVQRKSDTSLEVADLEDFSLAIDDRVLSFTSVVKGYKSIKHSSVGMNEISHQILKAYNGTFPDYILLILAKPPVDGVITNLIRYGESVGNKYLIILVDPIELTRFLIYYHGFSP